MRASDGPWDKLAKQIWPIEKQSDRLATADVSSRLRWTRRTTDTFA